jgi:DNA repair exonuclease SbcCD nuclease subunit
MSKVIVFSDLHINDFRSFNENGERLTNTLGVLYDMFEAADNLGIDTILFVGDLFDQQKSLLVDVVNKTTKVFKDLFTAYPEIRFICISGNHDHANKNLPDQKSICSITYLEEIFSGFIIIDNDGIKVGDYTVWGIPYYQHKEHFIEKLNKVPEKADLVLIHQNSPNSNPMIKQDFAVEDVERFKKVFCGHIHKYEKISDNLTIVGSPLHKDLSDEGQDKGYLIYDFKKNSYKRVLLDYPKFEAAHKKEVDKLIVKAEIKVKSRHDLFEGYCTEHGINKQTSIKGKELLNGTF